MRRFIMIPLLAAGLALGACAQKSYPPSSGVSSGASSAAPAAGTALPPPDTAPAAGGSDSAGGSGDGWVSTYPYGTATGGTATGGTASEATGSTVSPGGETPTAATVEQDDSGGTVSVLSSQDDQGSVQSNASGWQNPDVTPEQHQADIEGCYRYAWSQVERDMRVEQDVGAARTDGDDGLGFTALTTRMNLFDHRNRRTELINDCMEGKGYIQG